ncbi:alpha-(1,3)-fucosyltransferase C-like [Leguminivora glycinivorella]|uniref:alpha-(1,3)-fucosyltransferase C-like n=1 Tax=Leguminivora glycinivorella TaxID=1035111 RepID=UPI00200CD36B|nr:alpha-(1,3)-fucosyltransferase C-like [Leguminivora glycinivorella]
MRRLARSFYLLAFLFLVLFLYQTLKEIKKTQHLQTNKILEIEQNLEKMVEELQNKAKGEQIEYKHIEEKDEAVNNSDLKYILQWTSPKRVPFVYMGQGRQGFIERNCKYTNCYVTSDKNLLGDVSKFDVIAFAGPEVAYTPTVKLKPPKRSPHQKYAFASIESAGNYPICSNRLDNFFNWTWTYRLDSESRWGYIIIRDAENKIIGPDIDMNWMKLEEMDPVSEELAVQLRNKTKGAAWFVSNCRTRNLREKFAKELQQELKSYDLKLDVYGKCGPFNCEGEEECFQMIKRDYYFYLSFENSFSKDYVTEKLLHGLKYNAIPIVYGGANYTRFMPDGIYLNARELGVKELAKKMKYLIDHPEEYKEYFRWTNHYSYYRRAENLETDDYCGQCALLNNEEMVKKTSIYKNFKEWWNDPEHCRGFD